MDFKVNIEVSLSKETMEFIGSVMSKACMCGCVTTTEDAADKDAGHEPEPAPAPAKPARQRARKAAPAAEASPAENQAPQPDPMPEPAPAPAPEPDPEPEPEPESTPAVEYKIEEVRSAMAEKMNDHREELVAKLREFGAKNVSTLAPKKYKEFIDYCKSLK